MAFSRSLLIKGLAGGLGACTACAGGVGIYKYSTSEENIENLNDKQLIEKAGLNCELGDSDILQKSETKNCSVKVGGKINVKKGDQTEEKVSFTNGSTTKLKVSKSEGYFKNLKFVVDSGDITLTKENATPSSINKLGQYETYEIKEEGGKYYLSLKDSAEEAKTKILVLPKDCTLPTDEKPKKCVLKPEQIKVVNFVGKKTNSIDTTGDTTLIITKVTSHEPFTEGYKLTFTFPSDVTINNKSIKANTPTDYKIKKENNSLTLEKAWEDDKLVEKVGLSCATNSEECTVSSTGTPSTLNVKVGEKTKEGITSLGSGSGKIKLEKDQPGYNEGLKFTITTGDISPINGTQEESIKLEEFETYEITEEGGKYYLTRKTDKGKEIRIALGLPASCNLPAENVNECIVLENESKDVKFDGQTSNSELMYRLKVENVNDTTTYKYGYKFTLMSDKDVGISNDLTIKGNTNTVFKIKKNGTNLSLEKAWEVNKLLEKVGLKDCADGNTDCAIKTPSESLKIKRGDKTLTATGISGGKIKLSKDQAGYNQGLKFTISDNDITLTGADAPDNKLEELETYEITEEGSNYYLTRKTTKEEVIKKSLSIPDACFAPTPGSDACSPLKTSELSAINFDGKTEGTNRFVDNGKANLTISKATNTSDFPLGYRFTFLTTAEMTISDNNKVKANIPTEFKIKKGESNALTLVKAWNNDGNNLITKVGLETCTQNTNECTIKTTDSSGLNVKQGETAYESKTQSSSSPQGKIKLYKDKKGYLEGFKFVIEENDITLNNEGAEIKLKQFETYGIEENGGKYYLSRKTDGRGEKIRNLGFPDSCEWEDFSSSIYSCSITFEKLKSVKFKDKKDDSQGFTGDGSIIVMFDEAKTDEEITTHPEGLKVSFISNSTSDINIPLNSSPNGGGAIVLKKNTKKEFKINKETNGTLSLEKAFNINEFVKEAGLENCYDNLGCSLKDNLNVWLESGKYSVKAKVDNGSKGHKVSYEEVSSGSYNKRIKFTIKNSITLQNGDSADGAVQKGDVTSLDVGNEFQVMKHDVDGTERWFLSKVK